MLINDQVTKAQVMTNAGQILTEMAGALRAGRLQDDDETSRFLAWDIGVARASAGVHPRESLMAASVFFRAAFATLSQRLQDDTHAAHMLRLVVTALEQSISLRIREAANSYTGILLNKVTEAQMAERRRIARELHDRIGHSLSVAQRQLELSNMYRPGEPAKALAKLEMAQQAIQETMYSLRQVTSDLHPPGGSTLEKGLLSYLDIIGTDDVQIELIVNGDQTWAPPTVSEECLLILREAARNALTHGDPSAILIRIDVAPHELVACVIDNGCGFDPDGQPPKGSLGLSSIRERTQLLGGTVTIASKPGRGARVDLAVPIQRRLDDQE
ncbi:sensor histidine kinase [Nonomuraea sp. B10E15]|uniref:sensor histidine kinase n=1 Tax=unclassified Nonomuraea TaxID=2593643 RepID=UPI00325D2DD7